MDENEENKADLTNPAENNTEQVTKEVIKTKAILVDENSIIKPTQNGVVMVINYDLVRKVHPEYESYSNEELKGILSQCSQDELHEIFAAGVKVITELELIKVLGPAETRYREDEVRKAEEEKRKEELRKAREAEEDESERRLKEAEEKEKNRKRKWAFIPIPLIIVVGGLTLASCPVKDPYPVQTEESEKDEEPVIEDETLDDEDIEKTITEVKHTSFTIYYPDDSTQLEKAVTDYGNQESASNDRKQGTTSDGQDEWDRENKAMEEYDDNQKNIDELKELMDILKSNSTTLEEKEEALRKMLEPSIEVSDSYDSEQMDEMVQNAIKQSQESPDEITEQEVQVALEMQEAYEKQKRCQESNVKVLMYLQYLEENGYEIGDIEVSENERGDLIVSITAKRTVDKSKQNVGSKSFEEYSEALDEYLGADPDHDIRDFNSYLQGEEERNVESLKLSEEKSGKFSREEYEKMVATRNPIKVLEATDMLIEAMKDQKSYTTTIQLGDEDTTVTVMPKNQANSGEEPINDEEGDVSR